MNDEKLIDSYLFKWKCMELPRMALQWQTKKEETESDYHSLVIPPSWRLPTVDELLKNKNKMTGYYFSSEVIDEHTVYGVLIGKGRERVILKKTDSHKIKLCKSQN